jgi:uncharacterized membrane protein
MVVYHFCFDLSYFGLADFNFYRDPFWLHSRTFILSMFLLLVGVSLVLAAGRKLDTRRYMRRLAMLIASAVLISVSTRWMFGDRFIFFGVLHFITLASVLGLLFVRAGWANLVLGIAVILLANRYQFSWFDTPGWRWIGLMTHKPQTEDYVPLVPWFGVVLLGLYAGPYLAGLARQQQGVGKSGLVQLLAFGGRHSLVIYLLHQPLLLGVLSLYVKLNPG